jgi:hypothetical protein
LASVFEERGVEVYVLDQPSLGLTVDEFARVGKAEDPELLVFRRLQVSGKPPALISRKVKQITPTSHGFWQPPRHLQRRRILRKYPSLTFVCRGEGEKTIVY